MSYICPNISTNKSRLSLFGSSLKYPGIAFIKIFWLSWSYKEADIELLANQFKVGVLPVEARIYGFVELVLG